MLRKLDKYEILEEIGHGGMATVYRARDTRLERFVAVKVMHPHLRGAREARVRFDREARSVARLRHANILEIYDTSSEDSDEGFIVTELLTGPTLKVFVERAPPIPSEVAAAFGVLLARALGAAHGAGIVHRDVKPENVLLHENRDVKLTDFGIAQLVDAQSFTATGQILGSPGHMAPEQIEGGECDARVDVFALGTVIYYLATGRLPFFGRNPHQVLKRVMDGDYPDPERIRPGIGRRLTSIITRAMAREPSARYDTARALEEDLLAFLRETGFEDPAALVRAFLANPAEASGAISAQIVRRLTENGRGFADRGDIPAALDAWNRVLALDEGNAAVLALVEGIGSRVRRRRVALAAGLGTLGAGTVAGTIALAMAAFGDAGARTSTNGLGARTAVPVVATPPPDAARVAPDARVLVPADAGARAADRERPASVAVRPAPPRPDEPRVVIFRPSPQNVSIAIDDGPLRPFGPSFRQAELTPGVHLVRAVGAGDCCEEWSRELEVDPEREPLVVDIPLTYRPARIYVTAMHDNQGVVADVEVEGVRGRARSLIPVPLRSAVASGRVIVRAPGFVPAERVVELRAGTLVPVDVTLDRAPAP